MYLLLNVKLLIKTEVGAHESNIVTNGPQFSNYTTVVRHVNDILIWQQFGCRKNLLNYILLSKIVSQFSNIVELPGCCYYVSTA